MSATAPKGWCPSLFEPMATGDGLLVRVKPPDATLAADAARSLSAAAVQFGNGIIELTSRAAFQVRGLRRDGVAPFAAAMVSCGLAVPDPAVERRRAVVGGPGKPVAEIERALSHDGRLARLPPKFSVSVDVGDVGADIAVACNGARATVRLAAGPVGVTVALGDVPGIVVSLALAFLARGPARRMVTLVEAIGPEAVFEAAGLTPVTIPAPPPPPRIIGLLPDAAFGFGLPFGATNGAVVAGLAALSERYGDGTLRVTPWRALVVPGVAPSGADALAAHGRALGLIADPADPRRSIAACPGQSGCASGTVDSRGDAAALVEFGLAGPVHVSGCAKGCAHPAAARVTLVGENGRYGIVLGGRSGDPPVLQGLTIAQAAAHLRGAPA